jgi:hypothetical protein
MYLLGFLCVGISYTCWEFYRVYNNKPSIFHTTLCFLLDDPDVFLSKTKSKKEEVVTITGTQPSIDLTRRNSPHIDTRLSSDEEQLFKLV